MLMIFFFFTLEKYFYDISILFFLFLFWQSMSLFSSHKSVRNGRHVVEEYLGSNEARKKKNNSTTSGE